MAIYTYMGNVDPHENTSRISLRGGNLIIDLHEWADLTVQEYNSLNGRYILQPGAIGSPATPNIVKTAISLAQLFDVETPTPADDGKVLKFDEASNLFKWVAASGDLAAEPLQAAIDTVSGDVAQITDDLALVNEKLGNNPQGSYDDVEYRFNVEYFLGAFYTKGFINHGSDPNLGRPSPFVSVEWTGSVAPNNGLNLDTWIDTTGL